MPAGRNDGVHDIRREALPGQVARGLGASASSRDDPLCALPLALECGQDVLDEVVVDTRLGQVVPNERVSRAAICEFYGARLCEATVVDEPGADERCERLGSPVLRDTTRRELAVDLRAASITMTQGTERRFDSVVRSARCRLNARRGPPLRSRRPQPSPRAPAPGGGARR